MTELEDRGDRANGETRIFSASIIRSYCKNFETSRNRNVIKIQISYGISEYVLSLLIYMINNYKP